MKEIKNHYHNLVIGFGKGGKTLAAYLARKGQDVVVIERSEMMYGGSCINVACIPTKSLITNAEKSRPYHEAMAIKDDLTSFLRQKNYDSLNNLPSVTIITGHARFISKREVRVLVHDSKEEAFITADRIFINTGTVPFIPEIPGIHNSNRVHTSTSMLEQIGLPERLIIVGGGFIGLEFADMYAKFGSEVTLLDRSESFLPMEDADMANEIYKAMTSKKIRIVTGAVVESIDSSTDGATVQYRRGAGEVEQTEGSAILVATGRQPYLDELDVDAAGIKLDAKGFIEVDDQLKTNVENIWAIGDINGGPQFTYISLDDFRIIREINFLVDLTIRGRNEKRWPHPCLSRQVMPTSACGRRKQESKVILLKLPRFLRAPFPGQGSSTPRKGCLRRW